MIPDDGGIRQRAIAGFASTLPRIIPMSAAATAVRATCAFAETWQLAVTDVEGLESLQIEWGQFKPVPISSGDGNRLVRGRKRLLEGLLAENVLNIRRNGDRHMPILTLL